MDADLFRGTVAKYKKLRHIRTQEHLRAHTDCGSNTTFGNWFKDPDRIPIGKWEQIMDALNVPYEERWEMLMKKNKEKKP